MFSKQLKSCYSLPQQNSSVPICGLKIKFRCLHISFMLFFGLTQNYLSKPISKNILHSTHLGLAHDVLRLSCLCFCYYSNPESPPHQLELFKSYLSFKAQVRIIMVSKYLNWNSPRKSRMCLKSCAFKSPVLASFADFLSEGDLVLFLFLLTLICCMFPDTLTA